MLHARIEPEFHAWRIKARQLLAAQAPPDEVLWSDTSQANLFPPVEPLPKTDQGPIARVPREFLQCARLVSHHRDPLRWQLLYRVLWRLTHGEPHLLQVSVDDDVWLLQQMDKAIHRDLHKTKAFVRFRKVVRAGEEHFIAWHRPDHLIVPLAAPWFAKRFAIMRWTILTPDQSVAWNGHDLCFGPGVPASQAPPPDELEQLWKTYYAAIFNPARVKIGAMKREMPVRHWPTMPETELIDDLLRQASGRVGEMMTKNKKAVSLDQCTNTGSARDFIPARLELPVLAAAVQKCRGCDLYCNATQAVFGEGPATAEVIFVGEQPGDQEDLAGKPFVGPSGKLLDQALEEASIDRSKVYVTNAVKHFKFEQRGPRRIHSKPNAREMAACRPWLEAEIASVRPKLIVCLGATAAQSLMGPQFRITRQRGEIFADTAWAPALVATVHPSSILRAPDAQARKEAYQAFVKDLQIAHDEMQKISREKAESSAKKIRTAHPGGDAASGEAVSPKRAGRSANRPIRS